MTNSTQAFPGARPQASPAEGITLRVVSDPAQLEVARAAWLALLERSASNEPMLSPTWLLSWWQVYGQSYQLALGFFYCGGRLIGLAPLLRRRHWHRRWLPLRRLEFLGADVDEHDGVCSDYLHLIAERGAEPAVAEAFADGVVSGAFGAWDEMWLPALDGGSAMTALLADVFRQRGLRLTREKTGTAPFLKLPATWAAYLAALSKKNRYHVVRAQRDFDAWAAGKATFHLARSPSDLAEGKTILEALHNERWQTAGKKGVFEASRFEKFHATVMPMFLDNGVLELRWLSVAGAPVAAMYNLVWNNKVYFYQSGRALDLPRHLRPGIVLICHALRAAIEDGRREFDFLGGDSLYKRHLALDARPIERLRIARPALRERLRHFTEAAIVPLRPLRNAARSTARRLHHFSTPLKNLFLPSRRPPL